MVILLWLQRGIRGGKVKVDEYKEKVSRIVSKLGVPVQVREHPIFYISLPLVVGPMSLPTTVLNIRTFISSLI